MSRWREISKPIIAEVLAKHPPGKERKQALIEAYPFGERKYHPYKVWLDEVARQEGRKPPLHATKGKSRIYSDQHRLV